MQRENHMELNFEGLEMKKWNITIDKAQRVDKNGAVCLVIMLTPGAMVIKVSKKCFYFLIMLAKNQSQFGQNIYVHLKDII